MPRDVKTLYFDIRHAVVGLSRFASGKTAAELDADLVLRSAVERQLILIGEAMTRLRRDHPGAEAVFADASQIIGMRNLLVHQYEAVSLEVIEAVLAERLDGLLDEVDQAFADLAEPPGSS